jgi:DNA-binding CsgD family transcriptional regulator
LVSEVQAFRPEALRQLGLTPRECEVLDMAAAIEDEHEIAAELLLSRHAVRERLAHIEAKLDVLTPAAAVARGSARALSSDTVVAGDDPNRRATASPPLSGENHKDLTPDEPTIASTGCERYAPRCRACYTR